jgi:hypothetical protein
MMVALERETFHIPAEFAMMLRLAVRIVSGILVAIRWRRRRVRMGWRGHDRQRCGEQHR